jgi:transposase
MRYPDGGGLSAQGRARREAVRRQAAGWFVEGVSVPEVARRLRVSRTAVYGWRQRWRRGGEQALASKGPGGSRCRLDESRLRRLADALEEGAAVHGFGADQRWTLARVSNLIARMFHTRYTLRGTSYLLHRIGWSVQVPAHRAVERDEQAIATWRREVWPAGNGSGSTGGRCPRHASTNTFQRFASVCVSNVSESHAPSRVPPLRHLTRQRVTF